MKKLLISQAQSTFATRLQICFRKMSIGEKPLFWNFCERQIFPYVIPPLNNKEQQEVSSIVKGWNTAISKQEKSLQLSLCSDPMLISSCIPSRCGGTEHTLLSKIYMMDRIAFEAAKFYLTSGKKGGLQAIMYAYTMLQQPSLYFKLTLDSSSAAVERIQTDIRQGKSLCVVCESSSKYVQLEATDANDGSYVVSGEFPSVPCANTATHFIFLCQVQTTETLDEGEGDGQAEPHLESVVCIVPKSERISVCHSSKSADVDLFTVKFDNAIVSRADGFLCPPGKGLEVHNEAKASCAMLRSAIIAGNLRAIAACMQESANKHGVGQQQTHSFLLVASHMYSLESILYIVAADIDSGNLALPAATRILLHSYLHDLLEFCESSQNMQKQSVFVTLLEESIAILQHGEAVLTSESYLACRSIEETAIDINSTSTLELMQQRFLKAVGVGKNVLNLRTAFENVKSNPAYRSWSKRFEKRLSELEESIEKYRESVQKDVLKIGTHARPGNQEISRFIHIELENFARFCVLSRVFGALKSGKEVSPLLALMECYCVYAEKRAGKYSSMFDSSRTDVQSVMQRINLDQKIFNDLGCMKETS